MPVNRGSTDKINKMGEQNKFKQAKFAGVQRGGCKFKQGREGQAQAGQVCRAERGKFKQCKFAGQRVMQVQTE